MGITQAEWDTYFYRYTETSKKAQKFQNGFIKNLIAKC